MIRDREASYDEKYRDAYVGDTILAGNLTIQAGVRYDLQKSRNLASVAAAQRVTTRTRTGRRLAKGRPRVIRAAGAHTLARVRIPCSRRWHQSITSS